MENLMKRERTPEFAMPSVNAGISRNRTLRTWIIQETDVAGGRQPAKTD